MSPWLFDLLYWLCVICIILRIVMFVQAYFFNELSKRLMKKQLNTDTYEHPDGSKIYKTSWSMDIESTDDDSQASPAPTTKPPDQK
jgi:hypothetical protein